MKIKKYTKTHSLRAWKQKFYDYTGERLNWFYLILRLQGSVVPTILPWIFFFSIYSFAIALLYYEKIHITLPKIDGIPNVVLSFNLVLSLLLIFRTNTAYDRFWEGRKLWGNLVNTVRNLTRGIWIIIKEREAADREEKKAAMRLVVAFAIAVKLHLRRDPMNEELLSLMSVSEYSKLQNTSHPSLEITFWIGEYLQHQYDCQSIDVYQLNALQKLLDELVNILGGCERISKTPMPLSYAIYLRQLVVLYCLTLPVELVSGLTWWTTPVMVFISFFLFGIEEIGSELENPFGHNPNDLPLDVICNTMLCNTEDIIAVNTNSDRFSRKDSKFRL
jgi:ion channel-forming bestrophin family protein